ncbi:hypothetical protein BKA70DRAFT_1404384 [Coprinopsis sp. MPI-PUGE-AT-0042]|nr:hypothetical protein BKA70DRAFT_1404384 [Coprinopsis sp. MPI-PUGE-AT-0042]
MNDSTGLAYDSELAAEWQRRFNANMVAELFQMLDLEVSLIWKAQWSLVKALYIANRILPFLVLPFPVIPFYSLRKADRNPVGVGSCVLLAEVSIRLALTVAQIVYAVCYVSLALFIHTGSWGRLDYAPRPYGCSIISTHPMYVVVGYSLIVYNAIVTLVLSVWLGLINYHSIQDSPLLKVFYRDGVFYFIVIADNFILSQKTDFSPVLAVVNGVTAARLPVGYQFLLGSSQAAAHSVLVTRMVLHLKQQAASNLRRSNAVSNTYIQFELTAVSA